MNRMNIGFAAGSSPATPAIFVYVPHCGKQNFGVQKQVCRFQSCQFRSPQTCMHRHQVNLLTLAGCGQQPHHFVITQCPDFFGGTFLGFDFLNR